MRKIYSRFSIKFSNASNNINQKHIPPLIIVDTTVKRNITLALLAIINLIFPVQAEQHYGSYTVQIAAYKILPDNFIRSAEKYGSVYTARTGELARISVGRFDNRSAAQVLLSLLRQSGYEYAFIHRIDPDITSNENHDSTHHHANSSSEMAKFRSLSGADKDRAVFIDGKLHLKSDNRFIPVP
jgi:hypothetical protein